MCVEGAYGRLRRRPSKIPTLIRVQSLQKHSLILHLGVVYDPVWNFTIMPSRVSDFAEINWPIIAGGCVGFEPTAITSRYYVVGGSPARTHDLPKLLSRRPMSDSPRESLLSLLSSSFSNTFTPYVIIVASLLTCAILVARYALPTRMIIVLDKCLREVEDLYYDTCETHSFNLPEAEKDIAARLLDIQDEAARLRIRTLRLIHAPGMAWWSECRGFFMGHSLAIWLCTLKIHALQHDLQLRQHKRLQASHAEFAAGNSPAWQLRMRQRYCGSDSHHLDEQNVHPAMRFIREGPDSARPPHGESVGRVQPSAPGCGRPRTIGGVGLVLARISPVLRSRVARPARLTRTVGAIALDVASQDVGDLGCGHGKGWGLKSRSGTSQWKSGRSAICTALLNRETWKRRGTRTCTSLFAPPLEPRARKLGPETNCSLRVAWTAAGWRTACAGCGARIGRKTGDVRADLELGGRQS
ncbi:hypothetical protein B0H10DRAFT_1966923 [Mycena sp. CBHHK59/15]|nr:hypothetical protein B0H10DRAFT_1966923 [Mycena sp. CBHHK59/15]